MSGVAGPVEEVVGMCKGERTEVRRRATFVGDVLWRRGLWRGRRR